ncbi:MAG: hypothetical protein M3R02_20430 [Chloroflexota bacterium]|nr:hypothetical protein [Chloroflexota bacterium]
MATHSPDIPAQYDYAGQAIRIEAHALARGYGLDADRVRYILERTATDAYGRLLPEASPVSDNLENGLRFHPVLDEALAYLPPDEALSAFERADPSILSRRVHLITYLADPIGPYHTVDDLADLLESYRLHLKQNLEPLMQTGYPRTSFAPSPWLDWHLSLLSPTKLPISAFERPSVLPPPYDQFKGPLAPHETKFYEEEGLLPRDTAGNLVYAYAWATEAGPLAWSKSGPRLVRHDDPFNDAVPLQLCGYAEAALMEGMPSDLSRQLEVGRPALLQVKLDVIGAFVRCLRLRSADALWPAVLNTLTDALLWQEAQQYFEAEALYWTAGLGDRVMPSYYARAQDEVPGTLSALLSLVGHVEKELRVGTIDRTKAEIKEALSGTDLPGIESYFQAVGHPRQVALDAALDGFWALEEHERAFWDEFRGRVNADLENELREEVVIRLPVKRRHATTFEPYVRTFAEWQRTNLEATGALSPVHLSPPSTLLAPQPNVFRRHGQVWDIVYAGHLFHLKDSKGLRFLAHLLRHRGREFHALDLVGEVEGQAPSSAHPVGGMVLDELVNLGLSVTGFGDAGEALDPQAKAEIKQHLQDLDERLQEALELRNDDGAEAIEREREVILRYLAGAVGLHGRDRKAASAAERARLNVTRAIGRALEQIAQHHAPLRSHLRAVTTGMYFSYAPPPAEAVDWDL